jgi:hypothetical protein
MEKDVIQKIYEHVIPVMLSVGISDTPTNRRAYLIGVRHGYQKQEIVDQPILDALTAEICRLGDELPI